MIMTNDTLYLVEPLTPSGFNITQQLDTLSNTTIMFEWDPPQGYGPEVIVARYVITISPQPLSHPTLGVVNSTYFITTVEYNEEYEATLTAENCAGESNTVVLSNIRFSEYSINIAGASQLLSQN